LGELGYNVELFTFHDTPRRAHSIAAQGGINAAKNYPNDGDSVYRLFYDTIKGGDYRAREANVYRLAQLSVDIIDQCVAQGVPFAREYAGLLANRSCGGVQVARVEAGRVLREPLLHADPPDVHPRQRRLPVEAHADVGVAAQRRSHLGAAATRRPALAGHDSGGGARLLPRAALPRLREPRA